MTNVFRHAFPATGGSIVPITPTGSIARRIAIQIANFINEQLGESIAVAMDTPVVDRAKITTLGIIVSASESDRPKLFMIGRKSAHR